MLPSQHNLWWYCWRKSRHDGQNPYKKEVVKLNSCYGLVGVSLRTAQVTATIFWISVLACAEKGWAAVAVALGALVLAGTCAEAGQRGQNLRWIAVRRTGSWDSGEHFASRLLNLWQPTSTEDLREDSPNRPSVRASLLWSAIHLALIGAMAAVFFDVRHVPNNYANKTLPVGDPGDPQHYDCHDRTSGLYPAYLASGLCVLLAPLYAALDPEYGAKWMGGGQWTKKDVGLEMTRPVDSSDMHVEELKDAESRMRETAVTVAARAPLLQQVEALWAHLEGTVNKDGSGNWILCDEISVMATGADTEYADMCELLGAEPVRGPRAVLGGRGGTVTHIGERAGVEKIEVRWEDDGTTSPDVWDDWEDAIKVSELDEPLGEGSAVRHDGRRGTAMTEPHKGEGTEYIQIRWQDDGTLSFAQVPELEVEMTVGRDDFAAACAEQPERTTRMYAYGEADTVVLETKIAAVWQWADTVDDEELGCEELQRLADAVSKFEKDFISGWRSGEVNYSKDAYRRVCAALGVSCDPDADIAIGREDFAAACAAQPRCDYQRQQAQLTSIRLRQVEYWFELLRLKLEVPMAEEPGCCASTCSR
jgi:hypothetical protein